MKNLTPFQQFIRQALLYPLEAPFLPPEDKVVCDYVYADGQLKGTYGCTPPPPVELLLEYLMYDNAANTNVADTNEVNNGVAYQNTNVLSVLGPINLALSFDGGSDQIVSENNVGISGVMNRTFDFFAKVLNSSGDVGLCSLNTSGADQAFDIIIQGMSRMYVYLADGTDVSGAITLDSNFHRYTVTYDGTTISLYFDKSLIASRNVSLNTNNDRLHLGGVPGYTVGSRLNGAMSNVRVFSKCFTAEEIAAW